MQPGYPDWAGCHASLSAPGSSAYRPGLNIDAIAPINIITAAAMNTTVRPEWNGSEINCGMYVFPVSRPTLTPESCSSPGAAPIAANRHAPYITATTTPPARRMVAAHATTAH